MSEQDAASTDDVEGHILPRLDDTEAATPDFRAFRAPVDDATDDNDDVAGHIRTRLDDADDVAGHVYKSGEDHVGE